MTEPQATGETMTGGQAAVRALVAHGITHFFGLPGVQNDWLYNAIHDEGFPFEMYTTRHEQGAAYMALGYALTSDRVGVMSVVPGPGLLNAAAGIATGYGLGARMLALVGQIASDQIDAGRGALHEIVNQPSITENITKWQTRATSPSQVAPLIEEAFQQIATGAPAPCLIEIPPDVLAGTTPVHPATARPVTQPAVDPAQVTIATELIAAAKNPMIVVGGGALDASVEVSVLASMTQIPVMAHRRGPGVVGANDPLSITFPVAHRMWPEVDLVIAIGSRLQMPLSWGVDDQLKQIWINPDPEAATRGGSPDANIVARIEDAFEPLVAALKTHTLPDRSHVATYLDQLRADESARIAPLAPQLAWITALRDQLGPSGVLVTDLTQIGYVLRMVPHAQQPRTFIHPGYPGTLGYGFATALGAKVANPHERVIAAVGDGGFMFTVAELATAVQYNIDTITVVFDNQSYGNVALMQRDFYDGRVHSTDLANPDFVSLAESFGALGLRIESPDELAGAVATATDAQRPTIIHVPVPEWPSPWPFLKTGPVRGAPSGR